VGNIFCAFQKYVELKNTENFKTHHELR